MCKPAKFKRIKVFFKIYEKLIFRTLFVNKIILYRNRRLSETSTKGCGGTGTGLESNFSFEINFEPPVRKMPIAKILSARNLVRNGCR